MRCQTFSFSFFPCSADHERDWPPCKIVFFGLATNALNVRNNNNNNILYSCYVRIGSVIKIKIRTRLDLLSICSIASAASVCVVCVFFPFILDIKFVGRTSRGHTGERSHRIPHPPFFYGACLNFSREKDSAIPFPRRP